MIRILNLIDDTNIGGVTRGVADTARRLGKDFRVEVLPVRTAWRLAPRFAADIVVVDFTVSWVKLVFLLSLRLRFSGAIVIVEHSYTASFERSCVTARARFRMLLRLCYRLADRIVAVSDGQAAWLRHARLVSPDRLVSIPQSLDLSALSNLAPPTRGPGPLRLGAYGRYATQKGFDVLIEAMRMVPPYIATLDLAGYGPEKERLVAAAADLPHVRVGGPVDGPVAFLANIDVVAIPSRWEAYGLVAQEARAAGRPVIVSAVDGLIEQVRPAWGLVVSAEKPTSTADAIFRMASMDLSPMAEAARASAQGSFERKITAWRSLFQGLVPVAKWESPIA